MKELPEGATGQILALALGALALAVVCLLIVSPILGLYGEREEFLDRRAALAQRYEILARQLPVLQESDKNWRDRQDGEMLLEGSSDALAFASLQAMMKSLVEKTGASLTSSEVLPPAAEGRFRRVGIRVVFSGDLKRVTTVLKQVETARPMLSVGDFSLRAGGPGEGSEAQAPSDESLSVSLDIYGFRTA